MLITSAQNSKIKLVKRLRGKRGRQQEARFVIDYERDLRRAWQQDYQIDFILHCPEVAPLPDFGDVEAHQVSPALLKARQLPRESRWHGRRHAQQASQEHAGTARG